LKGMTLSYLVLTKRASSRQFALKTHQLGVFQRLTSLLYSDSRDH
jgi:hypothetical protein